MSLDRRELFRAVTAIGIGSTTFQRAVAAETQKAAADEIATITVEMVKNAEWISGVTLTEADRKAVANSLNGSVNSLKASRKIELPNSVAPAFQFNPTPNSIAAAEPRGTVTAPTAEVRKHEDGNDLAFFSLADQATLIRTKKISSVELTKLSLERFKKYDPALLCVITQMETLALKQAAAADQEIAAGNYRGPLHGIPWGAKDLIAYPGYPTTWGAGHFKDQKLDVKATVAKQLEDAGAVLVAKLSLGSLAWNDNWFGGMTRNPWNVKQGSSGSSAGSCSAVAAGLVPFAIGSETLGSIVSPSTRCGVTGLRPTFGRVSRHGCMALSWTMDKLGPIARSAEDCALVFGAIHGADGLDPTAVTKTFHWPRKDGAKGLRVGYIETATAVGQREELKTLQDAGAKLVLIKLPTNFPLAMMQDILDVEAAAAFDDLTLAGVREGIGMWPNTFRAGRFISAVDYIRANRHRTMLMQEMAKLFETIDLYVGGNDLLITNLTGHPSICMPNGFRKANGIETPTAITFSGRLYGETDLLAAAHAFQTATQYHLKHPPMDKVTKENVGL